MKELDYTTEVGSFKFGLNHVEYNGFKILVDDSNMEGIIFDVYKGKKSVAEFTWLCDAIKWCGEECER